MKVCIYLDNSLIPEVDISRPELGNPGIGGTPFLMATLPYYLQNSVSNYSYVILAHNVEGLPVSANPMKVTDIVDAVDRAEEIGADFFIYRPITSHIIDGFYNSIKGSKLNVIVWAHNSPDHKSLDLIAKSREIKAYVCVSKEQQHELLDDPVYAKSLTIYNGFDESNFIPIEPNDRNFDTVVYLGSLVEAKGFHKVAEMWHHMMKLNTSLKLLVIGSAKVYNRSAQLGKWGVADEKYERKFRKFIEDENGNPHPSVTFLGLMGVEKKEVMSHAGLGIVNPTGKSENCPGSAIEFQALKIPVISGPYRGLYDTVEDKKTGLLIKSSSRMAQEINSLLSNIELNLQFGNNAREFVKQKFDYNKIAGQWIELFNRIGSGKRIKSDPILSNHQNLANNLKPLRMVLGLVKFIFPPFRIVPSIIRIKSMFKSWVQRIKTHLLK